MITDPESKASIEESFLALARLTYEERRFAGIKDNDTFEKDFQEVYKAVYIEGLFRFALNKRLFPWQKEDSAKQQKAEKKLQEMGIKDHKSINWISFELLEIYEDFLNPLIENAMDEVGLPSFSVGDLKEVWFTPFFQENSLGQTLLIRAMAQKAAWDLKDPLDDIKKLFVEKRKEWRANVARFWSGHREELLKLQKEYPLHKTMLKELTSPDQDGNTPLHLAIEFGDLERAQKLCKESPKEIWSIKNRDGLTPLALAAYNLRNTYEDALFEFLLDHIQEEKLEKDILNIPDNQGSSVLHHLAAYGNVTLLKQALEYGADLETQDQYGRTPIMFAVANSQEKAVEFLQKKEAKLSNNKTTALHEAAKVGSFKMIQKFKEMKEQKDQNGLLPFDWAQRWVNSRLPGFPEDHLEEILGMLNTGQWSLEKKTEFLIQKQDWTALFKILDQQEKPSQEIQQKIIKRMVDNNGLINQNVDDREQYLQRILEENLCTFELQEAIIDYFHEWRTGRLVTACLSEKIHEETLKKIVEVLCKQKEWDNLKKVIKAKGETYPKLYSQIIQAMVTHQSWNSLGSMMDLDQLPLSNQEEIILALIKAKRWEGVRSIISHHSQKVPFPIREDLAEKLLQEKEWKSLRVMIEKETLFLQTTQKIIKGMIADIQKSYHELFELSKTPNVPIDWMPNFVIAVFEWKNSAPELSKHFAFLNKFLKGLAPEKLSAVLEEVVKESKKRQNSALLLKELKDFSNNYKDFKEPIAKALKEEPN